MEHFNELGHCGSRDRMRGWDVNLAFDFSFLCELTSRIVVACDWFLTTLNSVKHGYDNYMLSCRREAPGRYLQAITDGHEQAGFTAHTSQNHKHHLAN